MVNTSIIDNHIEFVTCQHLGKSTLCAILLESAACHKVHPESDAPIHSSEQALLDGRGMNTV